MNTQSSKVRYFGVIFDQFLHFDDHITDIMRNSYFHIRNIGKIRNLLLDDACLLLCMHLLVVDYIIVIIFCTMFQGIKWITKTS